MIFQCSQQLVKFTSNNMIIDNQVSDTHLGDRGRVMGGGDPDSTIFLYPRSLMTLQKVFDLELVSARVCGT